MDSKTLGDQLSALKLSALMPAMRWHTVQPICRTCEVRAVGDPRAAAYWEHFTRDELMLTGRMLRCSGGAVVLVLPFDLIRWKARPGCLLHEVRPLWDGYLLGDPFVVQDYSDFTHGPEPLDYFAQTSDDYWQAHRFFDARFLEAERAKAHPR